MKLTRIELEEFRRFRTPLVIDDLQPGLNILCGANEAGKSTLALALRAAFLERFRTSKASDFAPAGMSGARPRVDVQFEFAGRRYHLQKSFLQRARCVLSIDGQPYFEGEAAEDELARLFGYDFAAKGMNRPENWGIPGLLWVEQGSAQSLEPASHARGHLREALTRISGELTATDGDRLCERVSDELGRLVDARGKPRGAWREAEERWQVVQDERQQLREQRAALDADVDQLARWLAEHDAGEREAPWLQLQQQADAAQARVQELDQQRQGLEQRLQSLQQLEQRLTLMQEKHARALDDEAGLQRLAREEGDAASRVAELAAQLAVLGPRLLAAQQAVTSAQAAEQVARQWAEHTRLQHDLQLAEAEQARCGQQLQAASAIEQRLQPLQVAAQPCGLDDLLPTLRQLEQDVVRLETQRLAVATRLVHTLEPGQTVQAGATRLSGTGELWLTQPLALQLPGLGQIVIEPGGRDLASVAVALEQARAERTRLLQQVEQPDLAAAEQRLRELQQLRQDVQLAQRELMLHAPAGLPALARQLEAAGERVSLLQRQLAQLPTPAATERPAPDEAARRAVDAGAELARLAQERQQLETRHAAAAAAHALLATQRQALAAQLQDPVRRQRLEAERLQLHELRDREQHERASIAREQAALAAQRPELHAQDAERYGRSARLALEQHQQRLARIRQLQGRLEQAGEQGLGERLATLEAESERLQRRRDEWSRRHAALALLQQHLEAARGRATTRLQAPLQQRLQAYLKLVFAAPALELDAALQPERLVREQQALAIDALSFGTREQLGVLVRLAAADLLQQAGRPTLLLLDDVLVHSDEARRDAMKRALFDAATRHQILLLTCHPAAWRDMGVPLRSIDGGPAAG